MIKLLLFAELSFSSGRTNIEKLIGILIQFTDAVIHSHFLNVQYHPLHLRQETSRKRERDL